MEKSAYEVSKILFVAEPSSSEKRLVTSEYKDVNNAERDV
jgi:hypothetical protein